MCTEENVAKTKALETAPVHEMKFQLVHSTNYFKPAKEGFQIRPVHPRFQRGLREITQGWRAGSGYE